MENFPMLKPENLRQLFKAYNNGLPKPVFNIGISKHNALDGLLWWAMDSKIIGRALDPTTFTADVMSKSLTSFDDCLRKKDNTSFIKVPRYQENCYFEEWYLRFQDFLATHIGVMYTGLGYIIRPDMGATYDPANYAQNSQEELEQCMLLTGNKF